MQNTYREQRSKEKSRKKCSINLPRNHYALKYWQKSRETCTRHRDKRLATTERELTTRSWKHFNQDTRTAWRMSKQKNLWCSPNQGSSRYQVSEARTTSESQVKSNQFIKIYKLHLITKSIIWNAIIRFLSSAIAFFLRFTFADVVSAGYGDGESCTISATEPIRANVLTRHTAREWENEVWFWI